MMEFTIKSKFTVFLFVVLSAFFLMAVAAVHSLEKSTDALNEAIEEALEEEYPVLHLENLLQRAEMEAHDYLMYGTDKEREIYAEAGRQVSGAFERLLSAPFALDDERGYAGTAFKEWNKANENILSHQAGQTEGDTRKIMEIFDRHMVIALKNLEGLADLATREIYESLAKAYGVRMRLIFMVAVVFVAGFAIMIAFGTLILRSILRPVGSLKKGVERIGEGDYSHRVDVLAQDELGTLSRAFNDMAEKLEKSREETGDLSGP